MTIPSWQLATKHGIQARRRASQQEKALLGKQLRSIQGTKSVLEIGCWSGHFTRWLRDRGYQVTGLDSSTAMLEQAKAHINSAGV
ncbi:class I SAM-dependent methyltransferase [Pirellulaceae bacterium SH467]